MGAHVSIPAYKRSLPQRYGLWGVKCGKCRAVTFPPMSCCRECGESSDLIPLQLRPEGEIYSFTEIVAAAAPPEFTDLSRSRQAYTVALVRLDDGPKIAAQIVPSAKPVTIGARVRAVFKRIYVEEDVVRYGLKFEVV